MAHGTDLPSREGELLAGKYRLGPRLGTGGMGEVYRAHNEMIGRDVAIKLLHPEHTRNGDIVARFMREARAANLVRHPNVVDVLDLGQDEKGAPFIVQELLSGNDLGKYLDQCGGKLSLAAAAAVMIPVVDAVATAHAKGVVHRDLKPENVFLHRAPDVDGVIPKVLDFGISKIGLQPGDIRVTTTGVSMGTPAYMSPEQVQGLSDLDARTDVWALGVMLQELVTGALPFRATAPGALFLKICTTDPAPIDVVGLGLTADFARVVARCLRRDRDERYPTAAELARDLRAVAESRGVDATRKLTAVKLDDPPRAVSAGGDIAREATSATLVDKRGGGAIPQTADTVASRPPVNPEAGASASDVPPRQPSPTMNGVVRDTSPRVEHKRRRGVIVGVVAVALASVVGFLLVRPGSSSSGTAAAPTERVAGAPALPSRPETTPTPSVPPPPAVTPPNTVIDANTGSPGNSPAVLAAGTPVEPPAAPGNDARGSHRRGARTTSSSSSPAHPPPAQTHGTAGRHGSSHAATQYE